MFVQETLSKVCIDRIEFELMKIAPGFNVFGQSAKMLIRTQSDFEHVDLTRCLQIQTSTCHSDITDAEAELDFRLHQPVFQTIQLFMCCVNVKGGLPGNVTSMRNAMVVNHPRYHAGVGLVFMNIKKPPLNHRYAVPQVHLFGP